MKKRVILTVLVLAINFIAMTMFTTVRGPVEAEIAVQQLNDSVISYSVSRAIAEGGLRKIIVLVFGLTLMVIWVPYLVKSVGDVLKEARECKKKDREDKETKEKEIEK